MNFLRNILKPSDYFRYGTIRDRQNYNNICASLRRGVIQPRQKAAESMLSASLSINQDDGYLISDEFRNVVSLKDSIKYGNDLIQKHISKEETSFQKKSYLQSIEYDISLDNPFLQLALNKEIVSVAAKYLGFVPILNNINLWYSPNTIQETQGSQLYHMDHADVRQCKLFIPLCDIDEDTGPTTFLPAGESLKVANQINYRFSNGVNRVSDDVMYSIVEKSKTVRAVGTPGDIIFCDSCRCFHYGSRKATKPRSLLMIQYLSPFSFVLPLRFRNRTKFYCLSSSEMPQIDQMLLGRI